MFHYQILGTVDLQMALVLAKERWEGVAAPSYSRRPGDRPIPPGSGGLHPPQEPSELMPGPPGVSPVHTPQCAQGCDLETGSPLGTVQSACATVRGGTGASECPQPACGSAGGPVLSVTSLNTEGCLLSWFYPM